MAMDAMQEKPVAETIRDHYADIFQAERKVADYILENPEKAVMPMWLSWRPAAG